MRIAGSSNMSDARKLGAIIRHARKLFPNDGKRYRGPLALSVRNGDVPSAIMFVAEAPGRLGAGSTGIPFYSERGARSAKRFADLIGRLGADCDSQNGWQGHDVFVTDVVLRAPMYSPGDRRNRGISRREINASLPLLKEQIGVVRPRIVVALGAKACRALSTLFGCEVGIDGRIRSLPRKGLDLVGCPHPSPQNMGELRFVRIQDRVFRKLFTYLNGAQR